MAVSAGAIEPQADSPDPPSEPVLAGMSLGAALHELQEQGLKLLFSDRVVTAAMRVHEEPEDGSLKAILDQLLLPHGLEAQINPTGWLVVVRAPEDEAATKDLQEPQSGASGARPPQQVLVSDSIVVTPSAELAVRVLHQGKPVRGLGAEDFEILVGGQRQEILGLEVIDLDRLATAADISVFDLPAGGRRHFLLAFDTGTEVAGSLSRAGEAAVQLLREGFHPADLVGVATLSRHRAAQFALGFTSDRRAATAAIDVLTGRRQEALVSDPLSLMVRPARTYATTRFRTRTAATRPVLPPDQRPPEHTSLENREDGVLDLQSAVVQAERQAALGRLLALSESMIGLARIVGATPGRKHIVLFTEGFGGEILAGLDGGSLGERDRIQEMNRAAAKGEYWKISADERYGSVTALSSFDRMLQEFARSGSLIHPVDTRLAAGDDHGPLNRGTLHQLARRTGGTYIPGTGNLTELLESLVDTSSVTYLLRFTPPARELDARPPKLRVKLRRGRSGRVQHPPTYSEASSATSSALEQRLIGADLITGGRDGGDFPSVVSVERAAAGERHSSVQISVSAQVCSLPGACRAERRAQVYVYALAADGSIGDFFARGVTLSARASADPQAGFQLEDDLELATGSYRIRALVVDEESGSRSLASVPLEVGG